MIHTFCGSWLTLSADIHAKDKLTGRLADWEQPWGRSCRIFYSPSSSRRHSLPNPPVNISVRAGSLTLTLSDSTSGVPCRTIKSSVAFHFYTFFPDEAFWDFCLLSSPHVVFIFVAPSRTPCTDVNTEYVTLRWKHKAMPAVLKICINVIHKGL